MTVRCYQVPVAVNAHSGKTEHAYVAAVDPEQAAEKARAKAGDVIGEARLLFPWLDMDKAAPVAPDAEIEDGARQSDGRPGPKHPRTREVMDWLREYSGRNTFVLDVQFKVKNGRQATGRNVGTKKAYKVSFAQVEALVKAKDREAEWAKPKPAAARTGLNLWSQLPYGSTYAAAENERGSVSFVRMDKVEKGKWADWVFVKAVVGGNEDMRLGSQRPDSDDYTGQWVVTLANVAKDVMAAVTRYGLELGVCGICNRQLTNEESRAEGIGPVCKAKLAKAGFDG